MSRRFLKAMFFQLFAYSLSCSLDSSLPLRFITIDFNRVYKENAKKDSIRGKLFYSVDNATTLVKTTWPNKQNMRIEKNSMLIYYPESRQAFHIQKEQSFELPFVRLFVWTIDRKRNLEASGFRFQKTETKKGALVESWIPPSSFKKKMTRLDIVFGEGKTILSIQGYDKKNKTVMKSECSNYSENASYLFPGMIVTTGTTERGAYIERVTFTSFRANQQEDYDTMSFSIPPEVRIKEIRM